MIEVDVDTILQAAAADGSIDYSIWPTLLPRLIARIKKISHEVFPIPNLPSPPPPPHLLPLAPATAIPSSPSIPRAPGSDLSDNFLAPLGSSPIDVQFTSSSSDVTKEHNSGATTSTASLTPSHPHLPSASAADASAQNLPGSLPPQIAAMVSEITSCLKSTFPVYPPHTIQRIAELVLKPRQHYRSLATYLHALDRAVHVTSGSNVYPLPLAHAEIPGSCVNPKVDPPSRQSTWASPGSDEALGGALLTPIPWISTSQQAVTGSPGQTQQVPAVVASCAEPPTTEVEGEVRTESTETIDGPNGVGSIETVSVSVNGIPSMGARGVGVTQGELLRQEQRAGVVPVSQLVPSHHLHPGPNANAAAHQSQMQARMQMQRAMAQAKLHARGPSTESPDSPGAASVAASTTSSVTLEGDYVGDATTDNLPATNLPANDDIMDEDEEKPHARGPQEIGADDLGPQTTRSSTIPASTTAGGIMQGIDLQAAVGRKPLDSPSPSKNEQKSTKDDEDSDKMDSKEDGQATCASTPKREADDELDGSPAKKLKGASSSPIPAEKTDAESKTTTTTTSSDDNPETEETKEGDAMVED